MGVGGGGTGHWGEILGGWWCVGCWRSRWDQSTPKGCSRPYAAPKARTHRETRNRQFKCRTVVAYTRAPWQRGQITVTAVTNVSVTWCSERRVKVCKGKGRAPARAKEPRPRNRQSDATNARLSGTGYHTLAAAGSRWHPVTEATCFFARNTSSKFTQDVKIHPTTGAGYRHRRWLPTPALLGIRKFVVIGQYSETASTMLCWCWLSPGFIFRGFLGMAKSSGGCMCAMSLR